MNRFASKLGKWLNTRPYVKGMYITAVATCLMAFMSAIMCWTIVQNSESLALTRRSIEQSEASVATARNQLLATLIPRLDLSISMDGQMTLLIRNTGIPDASDLSLYQVVYLFDTNNLIDKRKILQGPSFHCDLLRSGATATVSRAQYFDPDNVRSMTPTPTNNIMARILSLVIVYRRQVDNRPFIRVEPCYTAVGPEGLGIGFLHQYDMTSSTGDPKSDKDRIRQITETEKLLFRIEE